MGVTSPDLRNVETEALRNPYHRAYNHPGLMGFVGALLILARQ